MTRLVFVAAVDRVWLTPAGNSGSFLLRHSNKPAPKREAFDNFPTDTMILLKRVLLVQVFSITPCRIEDTVAHADTTKNSA
jgi:hypothetical protein